MVEDDFFYYITEPLIAQDNQLYFIGKFHVYQLNTDTFKVNKIENEGIENN